MLSAAFLPLISDDGGSYGYQGDSTTITYHYGQDSDQTLEVTYYGTPVAEYNPEFWAGNISGDVVGGSGRAVNWVGPDYSAPVTDYTINIHISGSGITRIQLPDVICNTSITRGVGSVEFSEASDILTVDHDQNVTLSLTITHLNTNLVFGGWVESNSDAVIDPGHTAFSSNKVDLYVNWVVPYIFNKSGVGNVYVNSSDYDLSGLILSYLPYQGQDGYYSDSSNSDKADNKKYANIVRFSSDINGLSTIDEGTYRSADANSKVTVDVSNNLTLGGSVFLDNVELIGNGGTDNSPTTQTNVGIFANGHQLILGTGIEFVGDINKPQNVQVYGGTSTGSSHDSSTDVRVFSGTYSNLIGGTASGDTGIKSTHLVIVGNTEVLESVIGGNIDSDLGSSGSNDGKTEVIVAGNAYIFSKNYADGGYKVVPGVSTVIGGCRMSDLYGSSHVTVTGNAKVFAVQGGGRQATTYVDQTNVTISGKAQVNMVCGSVTDGGTDEDVRIPVDTTHVMVKDSALVGSVYGGGWDMYAEPLNESAEYTNVTIEGSPVIGAVFGGGFRGSIGTGDFETVHLTITGGTIGAVYGGGQGGPDPNSNSTINSSANTTGRAYVVGGVVMEITGGTIDSSSFSFNDRVMKVSNDQTIKFWLDPEIASGNVYGGGYGAAKGNNDSRGVNDCAKVTGDIRLTIGGTAVVNGSVYGGGKGTPLSEDPKGDGSVATVQGSVDINIYGGEVKGSLFGGGEYGVVDPTASSSSVTLDIGIASIGGDVFGGGLGEQDRISVDTTNRTITINGATIGGSVYGGSRFGDDNYSKGDLIRGDAEILIVSGNIASGSSGNVYGGGYLGHSNLNTTILIGSSTGLEPLSDVLTIISIFGGSSVGKPSDDNNSEVLLSGDTSITISNGFGDEYGDFSITGDVFGEGDYCAIGGTSSIWIEDFRQSETMLSIQKADVLRIIGSEIVLDGNMDGSSTTGSEKLALNLIGNLILQKSENDRATELTLNAAASQISGYSSFEGNRNPGVDDSVGDVPNFSDSDVTMNTLVMNEGMIFSILGEGDTGVNVTGSIQGYTLLKSDSRGYYGAFVVGATSNVSEGNTGFYVFTERDQELGTHTPTMAQTAQYHYDRDSGGQTISVGMTMWYLIGVYKVETTVILQDGNVPTIKEEDIRVQIPKTVSGSEVWFVGGYVAQDYSGSLELKGNVDEITEPGKQFVLTVGTGTGDGQVNFGGGPVTAFPVDTAKAGDGIILEMSVETKHGFTSSGFAGAVTLHMVEMLGNIPINMFDVEVDIYLRVQTHEIEQTIVMRSKGGFYVGTTDAYLPVLPDNQTGLYYITNGKIENDVWIPGSFDGTVSLNTVGTNLNKNGWISSSWSDSPLVQFPIFEPGPSGYGEYLGIGGVYAPVLRFEYQIGSDLVSNGEFEDIVFTVTVQNEVSGGIETYVITLKPVMAHTVSVVFMDKHLYVQDESVKWTKFSEIMELKLDFGASVDSLYIAYKGFPSDGNANGYIEEFAENTGNYLAIVGGDILTAVDETVMRQLLTDYGFDQSQYTVSKVETFLEAYNDAKPNTTYPGGPDNGFNYSDNDDWYDSESCLSRFFFSSPISVDSLTVYAGYSIQVTVTPFYVDESGDVVTKGLSISPSLIMQGNPGDEIDLTDMLDGFTWTAGFELYEGEYLWYSSLGTGDPIKAIDSENHIVISPRADYELFLRLQIAEYSIKVQIQKGDGQREDTSQYNLTVDEVENADNLIRYGSNVKVTLSDTIFDGGYHIDSVLGFTTSTMPDGTIKFDGKEVTFDMPNNDMTLVVILTDEYRVTVELAEDGITDNSKFSLGLDASNNGVHITLDPSAGARSDSILMSSGTLVIPDGKGMGPGGRDVSITVTDSSGNRVATNSGEISIKDLVSDVTYLVFVSVEWSLTFEDEGYSILLYSVDPVTGIRSAEPTKVTSSGAETVNTGDVLSLVVKDGYDISSVTATGAVRGSGSNDFVVSGSTTDVRFSGVIHLRTATINVVFYINGVETTAPAEGGTVTISGPSGTFEIGDHQKEGNGLTFIKDLLMPGEYDVRADFTGYVQSGTVTIDLTRGDGTVTVRMDMSEFTIVFHDGTESGITVTWSVTDKSTVQQIYEKAGGNGTPAGWASKDSIVQNTVVPIEDMFEHGVLELTLIPVISDIGEGNAEKISLVILRTDLVAGYGMDTEFIVSGVKVFSSELKVTVTCENGKITLKSTEGGTGTFTVFLEGEDRALILEVYVLEPVNSLNA